MAAPTDNDVITISIRRPALRILCLLAALLFVWSERSAIMDFMDGAQEGYARAEAAHR